MRAHVVIGANYGDEGKGLFTDYLCGRYPGALVVRFNGGAQAGHTVDYYGTRHVFSHFGSGFFRGSDTFLSKFFIVNPLLFLKEHRELQEKYPQDNPPWILCDHRAFVTTPFDVMLNRLQEQYRVRVSEEKRHGSCGVGINETVVRSLRDSKFRLTVGDLRDVSILKDKYGRIGNEWFGIRAQELRIKHYFSAQEAATYYDESFFYACGAFAQSVFTPRRWKNVYSDIILEGAQGLLLDENNLENWPHTTRSSTGLDNVLRLCPELGVTDLDVYYVSRTYLTRHGAGPLPNECSRQSLGIAQPDKTNVDNDWQGSLRYAPLDPIELICRVDQDVSRAKKVATRYGIRDIKHQYVFTHCDEIPAPSYFPAKFYASYGPRAAHIRQEYFVPVGEY